MAQYVQDIMTKKLITANLTDSISTVRKLMKDNVIHSVLLPRGGRSWSIFTQTDLLVALESGENPNTMMVGDYATPVRYKARADWDYKRALQEMVDAGVKHLPVVDNDGNVIGIISSKDIIEASINDI